MIFDGESIFSTGRIEFALILSSLAGDSLLIAMENWLGFRGGRAINAEG